MNLDAEARARGLTRKGRDLLLLPYKPVRFTAGGPTKPTQTAIADAAECGFTYWADAPGTGFAWATDDRQWYHAIHAATRGGARRSRHACALMRERLAAEIERLAAAAFWQLSGWERLDGYREREIDRLQLALHTPAWRCDLDGPIVEHAGCSAVGVDSIYQLDLNVIKSEIEVGQ